MIFLIALAAFASTILGGLFALRLKDRLHLILGFSAGAVVGVAFFDLLPEAIELGSAAYDAATVLAVAVIGFATYLVLDRTLLHHHHHDEDHRLPVRGVAGAGTLSFHSFLDGAGVGLAFQVSTSVGLVVAAAVLAHDFSDGINTVNMILKHGGTRMRALRWLLADAIAPVLGIASAAFITVPEAELGILLSLFAGFFLYIGASDLIPESYHSHPKHWTTISTVLGIATLYAIIRVAGL